MLNCHVVMIYTNDFERFVKAVDSIVMLHDNLTIIDNSINKCVKKKYPYLDIYETPVQFTCSQSFNCAQTIAREHDADVLLMAHSDMEVTNESKLKEFLDYLEKLNEVKHDSVWGLVFTHYDSLVALNMDCMDVIGPWDQNITHYPIDIDFYYRIRKYGWTCLDYDGSWIDHHASSTVRKNAMMEYINHVHINNSNYVYYEKKWGGSKDNEKYIFPFNGQDLNNLFLKIVSSPIYTKLIGGLPTTEGGLLFDQDESGRLSQLTLLSNIIKAVKPTKILETGTQRYFFTLFLSNLIETFSIVTFDQDERCLKLYDTIKDHVGKTVDITFHCGDSRETLPYYKEELKDVDLAWVDGGHSYEVCYEDLKNVGELKIPYILVDDSKMDSVDRAIKKFLSVNNKYYRIPNPYGIYDYRGITVLRRKRVC
jgi:hypothetical protein